MDLKVISLLIMTILLFGIGLLTYTRNRKNIINISYGFLTICMAFWSFGLAMFYANSVPKNMLFWANFLYVAGGLIAASFFYFSLVFPPDRKLTSRVKRLLIFIPNVILFVLFFFSDLILENVIIQSGIRSYIYGPGHLLFDLHFGAFFFLGFLNLALAYKKSTGIIKSQIKHIIIGAALGVILAGITNIILPWFDIFEFLWLGPPAVLTWVIFNVYAILKYRLMDIRLTLGRGAIYFFSLITIAIFGTLAVFLNNNLSGPVSCNIIVPLFACLCFLIFRPLFSFYQRIASKYFYYTFYTLQQTIEGLNKKLNQTIELNRLTDLITRSLLDALKLDKIGVVFKQPIIKSFQVQSVVKFDKKAILSLLVKEDDFLIKYFQHTKEVIVREEIPFVIEKIKKLAVVAPPGATHLLQQRIKRLDLLRQDMNKTGIGLLLPLYIGQEFIGAIILGDKISNEVYTVQDIELLTTLSAQAAIAFNNALSYEEINQRKAELERFYKLTVGRELKMAELKKENKKLEERVKEK